MSVTQVVELVNPVTRKLARCPFHKDSKASMIISEEYNTYKCLACGAKGDTIDFWAKYNEWPISKAANDLIERFNLPIKFNYQEDPSEQLVKDKQELLEKRHIDYLMTRGIERSSIDEFRIGAMGDLIYFPIYDINDRFSFFVERSITGDYKGKSSETGGVLGNLNKVRARGGPVFLCEGYIDCIQAWQEGINAVCAFGASFSESQLRIVSKYFKNIVIAMDNDDAGLKASLKMFKYLKKLDPYIKIGFANIDTKDIGEHLLHNENIDVINLIEWGMNKKELSAVELLKLVDENCLRLERRLYLLEIAKLYDMDVEELEHDVTKK